LTGTGSTTCSARPAPTPNAPGPTSSARRPYKPYEPRWPPSPTAPNQPPPPHRSGSASPDRRQGPSPRDPALRVPGAVLADPVRLVDGWAHDRGAGSDAAGAMGVRVVHRDHGHAGNRAEAAWEPVAVGGRVQPYHMAAGADLAVDDRAAVIASERARTAGYAVTPGRDAAARGPQPTFAGGNYTVIF